MNQQMTIEKMKSMRLQGMAQTHYTNLQDKLYQDYTLDQYTALLVDQEWEHRQNRKVNNLLKFAGFRAHADVKDVNYTANRGLDKNTFERLAGLDFINRNENIIITGATGTGKSYLAQALGRQACIHLHKTKYFTTTRLMDEINLAKLQGTYPKFIKGIQRTSLLIIEDFGLNPFDQNARQALMDIVEYKYDQSSMIITSQIPVANWHELIGEGTIADAILDRLIHSSHRINLTGESLRKKRKVKNQ
ncbi:IS21-like element helper ATPase IstB [bacterium]|nr:IS21-like element helper ATPase IstB [bacterium]